MNIQELILNITTPIITTILIAILSKIFFIEPLKRHKEIKSKINGLNDEISNLKTSLSNLNKVKDDLTTDLANAKKQINEKVDLINNLVINKIEEFIMFYSPKKDIERYVTLKNHCISISTIGR